MAPVAKELAKAELASVEMMVNALELASVEVMINAMELASVVKMALHVVWPAISSVTVVLELLS